MKWEDLPEIEGKINPWCEKHGLHSDDDGKKNLALRYLHDKNLNTFEQYCFYAKIITDCEGIEFVVFSDSRFNEPVKLANEIILVPCFYPDMKGKSGKDPLTVSTNHMEMNSRYIYDGWIPVKNWSIENVRIAIDKIEQTLAMFSLRIETYFEWKPKYYKINESSISHQFENRHLPDILSLMDVFDKLTDNDRNAIYKSVGWLSQSYKTREFEVKFLFYMISTESLANYIEQECNSESVFFNFRADKRSKLEKRNQRRECFDTNLENYKIEPEESIKKAYHCIDQGSRKIICNHFNKVFGENSKQVKLLFEKNDDNRPLYDLRNEIAHGRLNMLNQNERKIIKKRITDIEKITREYITKIIKSCLTSEPFKEKTMTARIPMEFLVASGGAFYSGPVHMGIIYT